MSPVRVVIADKKSIIAIANTNDFPAQFVGCQHGASNDRVQPGHGGIADEISSR
jgi:hypothetical protein